MASAAGAAPPGRRRSSPAGSASRSSTEPVGTKALAQRLAAAELALVLHEDAIERLADVALPAAGEVVVVVGPEGGITPEELQAFDAVGARTVRVADHVLRTSTAGVVALGALLNR